MSIITENDYTEAQKHPTLGPHYFTSRRVAEKFIADFQPEHFKPLVDEFSKQFADRLQSDLENYLLSDAECNLQSSMCRMVDDVVGALLSGKKWAIDRYALAQTYDAVAVREAIAKHVPAEVQNARVLDLETEITRLKKDIEWLRR
jgi:hypothetical protein